ncbi:uncharacterized protein LOC118744192 [Rhagoletis pomonella]|uniref:uncharacterized protein LOC118744192 n=1 Tax=Rhagoletis pomonella TaxID=28610 RepID=UPI001784C021|nr:uncharacterized protein LOC118744192 [Rhagoletis pomonella]
MDNRSDDSVPSDYWCAMDNDVLQSILDVPLPSQNKSELRSGKQHAGFDNNVGDTWLYPSNLPQRAYQLSIVKASLFNNTLVVLPTGLGKTFIAAVVMYNIYRWYPTSKLIFLAPTRPLVAQQIDACQRIMPFPDEDTVELTGRLPRNRRKELWEKKRVFFATPQVVLSDICCRDEANTSNADLYFPFDQVKLIVVDEAHRAKGRYAYTEVVQAIHQRNNYLRVLALSATPGRTMEDIAEVVCNLFISHIEVRCDTSVDVLPYVHKRHMKTIVVQLGEELKALREEVLEIIDPYLRRLIDAKVLSGSLAKISRNFLLFEQKRFLDQSRNRQHPQQRAISTNFSFCISMYHALELLERHGMRVFVHHFDEDEEGRSKFVVNMEPKIRYLLDKLRNQLGPNPFEFSTHPMTNGKIAPMPDNLDFGHPKFEEARTYLLAHFQAHPDSRAIVFCEYRESVMLIYRLLLQHVPLLKPRYFVGQGGATGSLRPLTQKEQIQIMQDFRSGKNNILVATSIGEEGIDVGEVELIVCFDINTTNPQRFIQRIGRTGRQKQGNVLLLVTEGREQQILKDVLEQKEQTNAKILHSSVVTKSLYKHSPRLVPTDLDPKVIHVFIKRNDSLDKNDTCSKNKKINKKSKEKDSKASQDLRTFFKKKPISNSNAIFPDPSQRGLETQDIEKCLNKIDDYFKAFESPIATNTQLYSLDQVPPNLKQSQRKPILESQRFRHLRKLLQKTSPLIRSKELLTDPVDQIKSTKVSDDGKRFILRQKPSIVSDVLEKIKLLESLPLEPDEMSAEEKDVRHLYSIIEKLLGGTRLAVEIFIDDADIEYMVRNRIYKPFLDVRQSEYKDACDAIFEGLEEQGELCDNFDYIQKELKKTDFYKESYPEPEENYHSPIRFYPTKNAVESMIYETVDEDVRISNVTNNSEATDSILHWDDFAMNAPSAKKSTPVQGPLVKAFQRQIRKFGKKNSLNNTFNESNKVAKDDFDVIFVSETEAVTNTTPATSDKIHEKQDFPSKKIFENLEPNSIGRSNKFETITVDAPNTERNFPAKSSYLSDLDVDMEEFLEPFPEETRSESSRKDSGRLASPICSTLKEDEITSNLSIPSQQAKELSNTINVVNPYLPTRFMAASVQLSSQIEIYNYQPQKHDEEKLQNGGLSSNLPEYMDKGTSYAKNQYLKVSVDFKDDKNSSPASPLSSSQKENEDNSNLLDIPTTPKEKSNSNELNPKSPVTPHLKFPTRLEHCERSPNLYELYLQNVRKRKKLPEHVKQSVSFAENQLKLLSDMNSVSTANVCDKDKSFINSPKTSKLVLSSDSSDLDMRAEEGTETECEEFVETQIRTNKINDPNSFTDSNVENSKAEGGSETNCEEVAETQKRRRRPKLKSRLHEFIDAEAIFSSDDGSEEELNEIPCNQYVKDSMIVSSDEVETFDENAPTTTQMHAYYLQSVRSPKHLRRNFKIPSFREFNDQVYSQPAPAEPSQYVCDSFVVSEEDDEEPKDAQDQTICPLERAERILKERRRARGNFKVVAKIQKRRRIRQLMDSSDEDD